jgi:TP901 family phage tail tape measure protein
MVGSAASKSAMEWEAGMSQISKTTGIKKGTDDFAALDSQLKDLYSTMPTTVSEIQSVAAAAGSLGIEKSSIAGFTEVALQMGSAFDMPAEEAAVAMGKIKSQLKSLPEGVSNSTDFAKQMGSAVDYVGNEFNATERDVLDFATRTAGSLSALGGNAYEIAGWGGMLASVFPSAERAAGSFDALLTQLTTNEDSQAAAAELLGVSTEEFMKAMSTDPSGTLLNIGSALEALPADKLLSTSKALGGAYGMDTLTKMVGHTEEWGQAIDATVAAGQKGESIGDSFSAGANNAKSAFQTLKNSIGAILTDIGGPINAALTPVMTSLAGTFNSIRTIGENLWEPFTTAISPATEAVSLLASGVAEIGGTTLSGLVSATSAVNTAFQTGKAFVTAFKDELTNVITQSSTFQTISGYVDKVGDVFDSLKEKASDALSGIVSWLSDAIPSAISWVTDALGSMFSGVTSSLGLGGVAESVGGVTSGVTSFFSNVYDRAAKELGWKTEEATADGTEKGMEKGADAAKDGMEKAVTSAVSSGVNSGFDSAYSALTKSGVSGTLAGYMAAFGMSDTGAMAAYNRQTSSVRDKVIDTNIKLNEQDYIIRNIATSQGSYYKLLDASGKLIESTGLMTVGELASFSPARWAESIVGVTAAAMDTYLNFAENLKSQMSGAGEEIGNAFAEGMVPDTATIDSRLEAIRRLKLYDPTEAKRQGADNAIAYLEALKSAIESEEAAKARVLLDPDDENARAELERSIDNLEIIAAQNPLTIKVEADTRLLYTQVLDAVSSLSGTALDIKLNELGISNVDRYTKYAQGELRDALGELSTRGQSPTPGSDMWYQYYELYKVLIDNYEGLDQANKDFTWTLNEALMGNSAKWDEVYTMMGGKLDSATSQVTEAISKSNDLLSKTAENTSDMCEAMSDFGVAQEQNWASMGMGLSSYIGSTEDYNAFLETEYERGAYHPAPVQLGSMASWKSEMEQYLGKSEEEITFPAVLDTSQADSQLEEFKGKATEEQQMPIQVDDSQALAAIAAIDAAASKPVVKQVIIQEVGGGGIPSGYGSGNVGESAWGTPLYTGVTFPSYGTGDVFVPVPTLAIVGDRPGGEWVGGIDQAKARFGGGGQIVVNYSSHISGPIYGVDDLNRVLDENNRRLVAQIADAQKGL